MENSFPASTSGRVRRALRFDARKLLTSLLKMLMATSLTRIAALQRGRFIEKTIAQTIGRSFFLLFRIATIM
jgi:hypothetical protein